MNTMLVSFPEANLSKIIVKGESIQRIHFGSKRKFGKNTLAILPCFPWLLSIINGSAIITNPPAINILQAI